MQVCAIAKGLGPRVRGDERVVSASAALPFADDDMASQKASFARRLHSTYFCNGCMSADQGAMSAM